MKYGYWLLDMGKLEIDTSDKNGEISLEFICGRMYGNNNEASINVSIYTCDNGLETLVDSIKINNLDMVKKMLL